MKFNKRNLHISPTANIGNRVKLGDNCTIYDHVTIGDDSIICNNCIIGEPLNAYYSSNDYTNSPTIIGADSLIRSHTIIYAGCALGSHFSSGHRVTIREHTTIGEHAAVGTLSDIQGHVTIGRYSRLHSNVHLAQGSVVGDFVSFYPFSVMTNDPYPPSSDIKGGAIGSFTQIAVHAVILPGIKIGQNCLVGAGSVVSRHIPDFSLAAGNPAAVTMDIRKYVVMGKGHPYPWMPRFSRGMPWEQDGFEAWLQENPVSGL